MYDSTGAVVGLGSREASTVSGSAPKLLFSGTSSRRSGIQVHNSDAVNELWLRMVPEGATSPTISATDRDYVIPPKSTLSLRVDASIDVYLINSTGSSATSAYTAVEVLA
ncbi:MAG: hypothetical protein JST40_09745 [Armatimonadetes bacterium]|nr:hypothetical protein [Armatimonadota bacterium]